MKLNLTYCLLLASACVSSLLGASSGTLKWNDEFAQPAGARPDPAKWTYDLGAGGWGNQELETYTSDAANASVVKDPDAVDGKALSITALKTATGYTSARIKTQGIYSTSSGRIEARIKLPLGKGIWPAFWMLGDNITTVGWPACGEIDIMEFLGHERSKIYGTIHGTGYDIGGNLSLSGVDLSGGYHVYAIQWSPGSIRWYLNGMPFYSVNSTQIPAGTRWAFDNAPFFIILNLAVGGNWPGNPDSTTVFPQSFLIDYVRVYADGPAAPAGLAAVSESAGGLRLTWAPSQNTGGATLKEYVVERALDAGFTSGLMSFPPVTDCSLLDTSAAEGAVYFYRIRSVMTDGPGSDPSAAVEARVTKPAGASKGSRFTNVSSRCKVGAGDEAGIVGFTISGEAARVLVRAAGPELERLGVSGCLLRPLLTVYDSNQRPVAINQGWFRGGQQEALRQAFDKAGAFAFTGDKSEDCALLLDLPPGGYTAMVKGVADGSGIALIEAYQIE